MRYSTLIAAALLSSLAVPALAQDRTPPAGSLRALNPPIDDRSSYYNHGPFEGRSAYDRRARDGEAFDQRVR